MTITPVESFSPYSTAAALFSALPTWMSSQDAQRVTAYQVYEQIYWNVPDTFELVQRGSDAEPIYIPNGRLVVDTTHRFLCARPGFLMDPDAGSPEEQETVRRFLSLLFRRERWWSKFNANKRYGIMRGDWCWHILANPAKPPGQRIKIEPLDPAAYFPVTHPNDPDKIIAVHIVEQFTTDDGVMLRRQTYQKGLDPVNNDGTDTTIYNSIGLFDLTEWEALDAKAVTVTKPPTALPPEITQIPVYHIRNMETPGDPFGSSELRGLERMIAAVNQGISDEELVLALEGLGMYATDGGPPRNEQGQIVNWQLGPGVVVEHGFGSKFERVSGVTSVDPVQNHLNFLVNALKEVSGTPDAATGKVDVNVAESGISLLMQLGPLLSKVDERKDVIVDVHTQMFYDLTSMWLPAYEGLNFPVMAIPIFGNPLPENADQKMKDILALYTAGVVDLKWVHDQLAELGYDFPDDLAQRVLDEQQAKARATDPFATRMENEETPTPGGGAIDAS